MPEIVYYDVTFYEIVDSFDEIPKSMQKRGKLFAETANANSMGIFAYAVRPPQVPSEIEIPKKKLKEKDDE